MDDILVVCEFPKIFLNDLSDLPPHKEVKFIIDLVPRSTLMSHTPYRMALTELKELKVQLQELLENGYIRPNILPWRALVLLIKKKDGSIDLYIEYT